MEEQRQIWIFNREILEHLKFPEFEWWKLVLVFVVLGVLGFYFLLVIIVDRRNKKALLRRKQRARLEGWLEDWGLESAEEYALREMAGEEDPLSLFHMLDNPRRFEKRVHEAAGEGGGQSFLERVRRHLGYHSDNLSVPIVSTRQLIVGDHLRFLVRDGLRPYNHYGIVTAVELRGITVQMTAEGFLAQQGKARDTELFYLRGNDMEYRFPLQVRSENPRGNSLVLTHQLVERGHAPRFTRLPILRTFSFTVRAELESQDDFEFVEDTVPPEKRKGVLLEMSEGGFSLALQSGVTAGHYIEFALPTPRGREIPIRGRILNCGPFGGGRWLVRCELRGVTPTQRSALAQLLRLAWRSRMKKVTRSKPSQGPRSGQPPRKTPKTPGNPKTPGPKGTSGTPGAP